MSKFIIYLSLIVFIALSSSFAADDSIKVVPGNYSVTTTTRSSFNTEPEISTDDECIDKDSVDAKDFLPDPKCTVSNLKKDSNKLSFNMKCEGDQTMPAMTGTAEISATSKTVKSDYKMVGTFQGREFSVNSKSEGKLTGPCK